VSFYLDASRVEPLSRAAAEAAARAADPLATVAAVRARQLACAGPGGSHEQLQLAARIGAVGEELQRPTVAVWEPIWRIDARLGRGEVPEAVAELPLLRQRVAACGLPIYRWHEERVEALLGQATGRFTDAIAHAEVAHDLFASLEDSLGARAMHYGFLVAVELHTGPSAEVAEGFSQIDFDQAPGFVGDLPMLGRALSWLGVGDDDEATRAYDRLAPPALWQPPGFLWMLLHTFRLQVAIGIGRLADLPPLLEVLEGHRGQHAVAGGGSISYNGCAELWLGVGAAALERWDDAVTDLQAALATAEGAGTRAFAVHAAAELADALVARDGPGDAAEAAALVARHRPTAAALGMRPWLERLDATAARATPSPARSASPLSPREEEVAALVADGLTNRQIAERLYVSERTAQNHVQHILTKLGLANRTQVATWVRAQR
jgi:DNA-binding NarL/FixJ family response regulator